MLIFISTQLVLLERFRIIDVTYLLFRGSKRNWSNWHIPGLILITLQFLFAAVYPLWLLIVTIEPIDFMLVTIGLEGSFFLTVLAFIGIFVHKKFVSRQRKESTLSQA